MKHYGIDGCKGGWVIAEDAGPGCPPLFCVVNRQELGPIVHEAAANNAIAVIDMPIGLPDREARACDGAARQVVGPARASSVFPVPCRAAVRAGTGEASEINYRRMGKRLSKQSLAILDRIREIDNLMTPKLQLQVREAHPEVTFAILNGWLPLQHGKKTKDGERERLCLLRKVGIEFDLDAERKRLGARLVARDDLIDAAACLATARRIVVGAAQPRSASTLSCCTLALWTAGSRVNRRHRLGHRSRLERVRPSELPRKRARASSATVAARPAHTSQPRIPRRPTLQRRTDAGTLALSAAAEGG
jgi:predicted RNase H-like nuclease